MMIISDHSPRARFVSAVLATALLTAAMSCYTRTHDTTLASCTGTRLVSVLNNSRVDIDVVSGTQVLGTVLAQGRGQFVLPEGAMGAGYHATGQTTGRPDYRGQSIQLRYICQ